MGSGISEVLIYVLGLARGYASLLQLTLFRGDVFANLSNRG